MAATLCLALPAVPQALDLGGQAVLYNTYTSREDAADTDITYQDYRLNAHQSLTPYLTFDASITVNDLSTTTEDGMRFGRRNETPRVELSYTRSEIVGRIGYFKRSLTGTTALQNLDTESIYAYLSWQDRSGFRLSFRLQDDENVADVTVFGRDTDSTIAEFTAALERGTYSLLYSLLDQQIDSRSTLFRLDERRHTLRAAYADQFAQGKWSVSLDGRLIRDEQTDTSPSGTFLAEQVPVVVGLRAIDTSPEFGELEPSPGLADGDLESPVSPPIDIGGANLFRNIGVDLGFSLELTKLEISVDRFSDPTVTWEVYQSTDNLNWEPVGVTTVTFDPLLLRYTITFPRTTARYFKAVNVSQNAQAGVLVTEVRAFVDVEQPERRDQEGTRLRGFGQVRYTPHDDFSTALSVGASDVSSGGDFLLRRDSRDVSVRHLLSWRFARALELRTIASYGQIRRDVGEIERRSSQRAEAALLYTPLPTLQAELSAVRREESAASTDLRRTSFLRLRGRADLLENLRVTTEISTQRTDDDLAAFDLDDVTWRGGLEARLTDRWRLFAELLRTWYQTTGDLALDNRRSISLRTNWSSRWGLSASANVIYTDEDGRETVTQRYSLGWSPSFRFSVNTSFFETRTASRQSTSVLGASLNYRLSRHVSLFSTFSRSESLNASIIKTAQVGLRLAL